jgi:PAS domain S-box-containing protein
MKRHEINASIEAGGSGLLAVVRDTVRTAEVESSLEAAILRSLRGAGEAADLAYVGVALLDRSTARFDYRYEWSADSGPDAVSAARAAVQRYVRESIARLQKLEIVDRRVALIVPLASHGALAGYAVAMRGRTRAPWGEVEKNALALAAEVLMAEQRFRRLVDQAGDLIVAVDAGNRIVALNAAFETITGWPREEWIGRDVAELLVVEAPLPAARGEGGAERRVRGATRVELRLATRSGAIVELDVTISPVVDGGVVTGASWIGRDVTQRNRDQRELAMLLESTYEGIVAVDRDGICTFVNASACRILGCEPADLIGRAFHDFVHPRHACEAWPHAKTLCPLGGLLEMHLTMPLAEELFARRDGTMLPVQFAGSAVRAPGAAGTVVTFSDVTERKMLETELERANRMASLGHVAATIAHEFNNVLMGIQPSLDLMLRRAAGRADMAEPLSRIGQSVQRGKRIALEILRFSRPLSAVLAPLPLQPWLRDIADEATGLLGPAHSVVLDVPPEPLFVNADRELLHQAFLNLISNARDAMTEPGTLRIEVQRGTPRGMSLITPGRFIAVSVSDSGHGMSEETLAHIFEPLFTTKKGRGTGLGLAVVHQIVTAHGGYVFAESRQGKGATFTMFLGVGQALMPVPPVPKDRQECLSHTRVLLIEDDKTVAAGTLAMLSLEDIETAVVASGAEAVAAVERFQPTVVILDVGLPDADGRDVFDDLRARWPSLPVIFSTGHAETRGLGGEAERVRVLQKPYEIAALLQAIADVTKESS